MGADLRDYQYRLVEATREALAEGYTSPVIVLPTGGGKTRIFIYIADQAATRGHRVCILVHRRELIRQTSKHFALLGIPHGIIAPGHPHTSHLIQVASVQTLSRRSGYRFDILITDEGHHGVANTWREIVAAFDSAVNIGFTATPARLTGAGLGTVYDKMLIGPSIKELQEINCLSPCKLFRPDTIDVKNIRRMAGDYQRKALDDIVSRREIVGSVVNEYIKHCNGYPAIGFSPSVDHAYMMAQEFRACGFRSVAIDAKTPEDERDGAVEALGNGGINVLWNCDLVSEGFDVPVVTAVFQLRRTKSIVIDLQQVGRGLRPYPGKAEAKIFDHVGNFVEHGHPCQDREWSLEHGEVKPPTESIPRTRQCNHCFYVHDWAAACPDCGYVYPPADRETPKQVDGELEVVTEEEAKALWDAARRSGKLNDFHKAAKASGKSPGSAWAAWNRQKGRRKLAGARI